MIEFIFMLTRDDKTLGDARDVYASIAGSGVRHVGCKDLGLPVAELQGLMSDIKANGHTTHLEVVSESEEATLASARAAAEIGPPGTPGRPRYCPFPGRVVDHPSILEGTVKDITESARALSARDGVDGLDLLAYRWTGDVPALVRSVVAASAGPVIAAGSVDSAERIQALNDAGAWAFTIGGAIFDRKLPAGPSVREQVDAALAMTAAAGREVVADGA